MRIFSRASVARDVCQEPLGPEGQWATLRRQKFPWRKTIGKIGEDRLKKMIDIFHFLQKLRTHWHFTDFLLAYSVTKYILPVNGH